MIKKWIVLTPEAGRRIADRDRETVRLAMFLLRWDLTARSMRATLDE